MPDDYQIDETQPYEFVTVSTGGVPYEGWESITVDSAMDAIYVETVLSTTEIGGPTIAAMDRWNFPPGTPVEVFGGANILVTGFVESYEPQADANQHSVTLRVQTKPIETIKNTVKSESGNYENVTDGKLSMALAGHLNLRISDTSKPREIPKFQIRQGATVYAEIMRVLQQSGKAFFGTRDGTAHINDGQPFPGDGALIQGYNILTMRAILKDTAPGVVNVNGQTPLGVGLQAALQPKGIATMLLGRNDRRFRRVIDNMATTPQAAQIRADWEMNRAAGDEARAFIRVPGWRRQDGDFWDINIDVWVFAPWLKIDCIMRVQRVTFSQTISGGTITDLEVVDPLAWGGRRGNCSSDANLWDYIAAGRVAPGDSDPSKL